MAYATWSQWFAVLVLLLACGRMMTFLAPREGTFALRTMTVPALAIAAALAWPAWWVLRWWHGAPVPALGHEGVQYTLAGALVFIAAVLLSDARFPLVRGRRLSGAALVAVGLVAATGGLALHGLYQVHGPAALPGTHANLLASLEGAEAEFSPAILQGLRHALAEGRATGMTGQANVFAGLLALGFPLALAGAAIPGARARRIAALLLAVAMLLGVVASGSRGGLLAVVCAAGLFAILVLPISWRRLRGTTAVGALAILCMGAAAGDRWLGAGTIRQRLYYWESGFGIWSGNWLQGRGPGAYEVFYPAYRIDGAQETVFAHNWFVQWGTEVGAVGLLIFALWAGLCLWAGLRWWRHGETNGERFLAAGFLAAAITILVHGLVEFTLQYREPYFDLALLLGVMLRQGTETKPWPVRHSFAGPPMIALLVVAAFFLASFFAWRTFLLHARTAELDREAAEYLLYTAGDPTAAEALATAGLRRVPGHPWLLELRAFARMEQGNPRARDDFERALAAHPYSARLRRSYAEYEWRTGDRARAMELFSEAIERHPLNVSVRVRLAQAYLDLGEAEEARAVLREALGMFASTVEIDQRERLARELGVPTPM